MSSIHICELGIAGSELFNDLESFLTDLADEGTEIIGGDYSFVIISPLEGNTELRQNVVFSQMSQSGVVSFATISNITGGTQYKLYHRL
ncbi:MAG: hypothetical protein VKL59_23020 [Nostocaceae cyanobacterium]|nr:hypothetical protein [Nostocaceae cyanobacterium]